MKLSVVIPCYNEANTIEDIIDAVRDSAYQPKEIIVVDDGSSDGTREKLNGRVASKVDRVIEHERNQGKGEVGISYSGRTYAEGKKVDWKDGLWALYCIVKYNVAR